MLFTTIQFWAAFVAFLFIFALLRKTKREVLQLYVIAASLGFFYLSNHWLMLLLPATALVSWMLTEWMSEAKGAGRKCLLFLIVTLDLLPLLFFKYSHSLSELLNQMLLTNFSLPSIALLIGISFYTFQAISYSVDVFRRHFSTKVSFLEYLLYLSFFPQLIAGPIVKYHDISAQIDSRVLTPEESAAGIRRFIRGLAKKLLIADSVGYLADAAYATLSGTPDSRVMWLGAVCYTLQIYYDFSGYSDMAIGMGHMFGFTIRENFLFPYGASSLRDFWRRWHVSLSTWFREYLYIPLGGNRRGRARAALNRFAVFLCTGIWHGANWTFLFWGLAHGLLSSAEDWGLIPVKKLARSPWGRTLCRVYTLLCVTLLFAIFRADSLADGFRLIAALFSGSLTAEGSLLLARLLSPAALLWIALAALLAGNLVPKLRERVKLPEPLADALSLALLCLCILCLAKGGFHPFIYFQF